MLGKADSLGDNEKYEYEGIDVYVSEEIAKKINLLKIKHKKVLWKDKLFVEIQ